MNYRRFGNTDLIVSEIGFGAWGIGGPSMAGNIPIGWGDVNDDISIAALNKAYQLGINFFDTADFYGLGHSEELIGKVFANQKDVIIASKVGHKLNKDKSIALDYSKAHILFACDESLKRLKRDFIDYYQLHSARISHLENGECIEAMEKLKEQGKIRYWGISLNTFNPFPEAEYFIQNKIGDGFQLVLNIINQHALPLLRKANNEGLGIIARMPLQFGVLTGKFSPDIKFAKNDHRNFRLTKEIISAIKKELDKISSEEVFNKVSQTTISLSYILSYSQISTVIPGMKTPEQVVQNTKPIIKIDKNIQQKIEESYNQNLYKIVEMMEKLG